MALGPLGDYSPSTRATRSEPGRLRKLEVAGSIPAAPMPLLAVLVLNGLREWRCCGDLV